MKKLLALIALAFVYSNVNAQENKFMLEFGGSYKKFKQELNSNNPYLNATNHSKNSSFTINLGYQLTKHSYLGLTFKNRNEKNNSESERINNTSKAHFISDNLSKQSNYGLFYRQYLLPIDNSRWNAYAEFASSFQRTNTTHNIANKEFNNDILYYTMDFKTEQKIHSWDNDIRLGGSYRLSKNLLLQLSLHSIGNINYSIKDHYNEELNNKISYQFLQSPLDNINLSLIFKI